MGMSEKGFDELFKSLNSRKDIEILIGEVREKLSNKGLLLVADIGSIPIAVDIDCSEHDKEIANKYAERTEELNKTNAALTEKIKAFEENNAKTSELIREYDREILELKAQCQKLTQNERLAYKRHNGNTKEIPTEPIKIADWLIDKHMDPLKEMSVSPEHLEDMRKLQIDSLRQIAEHLLVFCGRE